MTLPTMSPVDSRCRRLILVGLEGDWVELKRFQRRHAMGDDIEWITELIEKDHEVPTG